MCCDVVAYLRCVVRVRERTLVKKRQPGAVCACVWEGVHRGVRACVLVCACVWEGVHRGVRACVLVCACVGMCVW